MNHTLQRFKDYCNENNINLMRDDLKFIEQSLQRIPPGFHREALRGYIISWRKKIAEKNNSVEAINLARREANQFLLFFVPEQPKE